MVLSGNAGAEAFRKAHPTWNTVVDEDIGWALKNFYIAYNTETDVLTKTAMGDMRLNLKVMACEGSA